MATWSPLILPTDPQPSIFLALDEATDRTSVSWILTLNLQLFSRLNVRLKLNADLTFDL